MTAFAETFNKSIRARLRWKTKHGTIDCGRSWMVRWIREISRNTKIKPGIFDNYFLVVERPARHRRIEYSLICRNSYFRGFVSVIVFCNWPFNDQGYVFSAFRQWFLHCCGGTAIISNYYSIIRKTASTKFGMYVHTWTCLNVFGYIMPPLIAYRVYYNSTKNPLPQHQENHHFGKPVTPKSG